MTPVYVNGVEQGGGLAFVNGWTANKLLQGAGVGADPTEIDVPGLLSKFQSHTRVVNAVDGSVGYTGYGFQPKAIIVITQHTSYGVSVGVGDVNNAEGCISLKETGVPWGPSTNILQVVPAAGAGTRAVLTSLDADGFTLTWTKVGSPGADTLTFYVLAFG